MHSTHILPERMFIFKRDIPFYTYFILCSVGSSPLHFFNVLKRKAKFIMGFGCWQFIPYLKRIGVFLQDLDKTTNSNYYKAQEKTAINSALIADTTGFIACYAGILIIGTLLITLTEGCTLFDAMFEFTSAFGTVGISNGRNDARQVGDIYCLCRNLFRYKSTKTEISEKIKHGIEHLISYIQ